MKENMTINKLILCEEITKAMECTKIEARTIIDVTSGIILKALSQGNSVMFGQIGTIVPILHNSRSAFNMHTKVQMVIPPTIRIKVKASKHAKLVLNNK